MTNEGMNGAPSSSRASTPGNEAGNADKVSILNRINVCRRVDRDRPESLQETWARLNQYTGVANAGVAVLAAGVALLALAALVSDAPLMHDARLCLFVGAVLFGWGIIFGYWERGRMEVS